MKRLSFLFLSFAIIAISLLTTSCEKDLAETDPPMREKETKSKGRLKSSFYFNRNSAANYAKAYTEHWEYCYHHTDEKQKKTCNARYNSHYHNYGEIKPNGEIWGDCANFVSQSLYAGGFPLYVRHSDENPYDTNDDDSKKLTWNNIVNSNLSKEFWGFLVNSSGKRWGSQSWRNVIFLKEYLEDNYSTREYSVKTRHDLQWNLKYLQKGDLIFMMSGNDGFSYDHVVIITEVVKSGNTVTDVKFSGHTWNQENVSFNGILQKNESRQSSQRLTYRVLRFKF
ncbi:MAG: amidase domain-containing protein [Bacteroidales bacterium]|jgi:hypothetical protein|nr:amidase domain-containing protein [Bacteroidales bacterium]